MFKKNHFAFLSILLIFPASGAQAFDTATCENPNVHYLFRTDVPIFQPHARNFVHDVLGPIIGQNPVDVDAGFGTPSIAGVKAACNSSGCLPGGAHFATVISGAGGTLGANLVGDAYVSNIPFNMTSEEHWRWLHEGGGLALEQELYNQAACGSVSCGDTVVVIPIVMGAHEDGLFWRSDELPRKGNHHALPDTVEAAEELFAGKVMRFFGNGGRLMQHRFGIVNNVVPGANPYPFMLNGVNHDNDPNTPNVFPLGVDFLTTLGNLDVFIERPGIILTNAASLPLSDTAIDLGYDTYYLKGWHQNLEVYELLVDKEYFDNCLSPEQQASLREAAKAFMLDSLEVDIALQCQAVKDMREEFRIAGGTFYNKAWPHKILRALKDDAYAYFSSQATPGSDFEKVFTSLNQFKPYVPHDIPYPDVCEE